MALKYHPEIGTIVAVNYQTGFLPPEMVKLRLAVIISPKIKSRGGLCTVVPLSTTEPPKTMPFHYLLNIPFKLPKRWGNIPRWVKGDMVSAVSFRRVDLLILGKSREGQRLYQTEALDAAELENVKKCVLHGLGMSSLTKHL